MQSVAFVVPGSIDAVSGGSIYNRRLVGGLRRIGWTVKVLEIDDGFPYPSAAALADARQTLADIPDRATVVIDGLALGAMPEVVEPEAARVRIVALIHLPLAADVGIDAGTTGYFRITEQRALATARLVVVTGPATIRLLDGYRVPRSRICVIEPGTDPAPLAQGSGGGALRLLTVAALTPGKGYDLLLRALSRIGTCDWQLTAVGSTTRDPATGNAVRAMVRELGMSARTTFTGELNRDSLEHRYAESDLFVLATHRETYGMAVAEALAHGLPVVSTTTGSIPRLVGSDAGLLVAPGDLEALTGALGRIMLDANLRERLAAGARRVRERLPTWDQTAAEMHHALSRLDPDADLGSTPHG